MLAASTLRTVRLENSKLIANVAAKTGGGILAEKIEAMELERIEPVGHVAPVNGGAGFFNTCPVIACDVVCLGNVGRASGGALVSIASRI